MPNVTSLVLRIFGNITFDNNTSSPIEVTLAYNDSIATPHPNLTNFATLSRDQATVLTDFFSALFPGIVVLAPDASPEDDRIVTDVVLSMAGIATYDDNTRNDFAIEYFNGVTNFFPDNTEAVWADMVSSNESLVISVLEELAGVGNVTLASYLHADCFTDCSGSISVASPGPVCGWTFSTLYGTTTETFPLSEDGIGIKTSTDTDYVGALKEISESITNFNDMSGRFTFTEYAGAPNLTTTYQIPITNYDYSQICAISLFGDGNFIVQIGDSTDIPSYIGVWTPDNSTHEIHFSTDSDGALDTFYIDNVEISMTFIGDIPSAFGALPNNHIGIFGGAGINGIQTATYTDIFLTLGNVDYQTILGCQ